MSPEAREGVIGRLQDEISQLAAKIDVPKNLLPQASEPSESRDGSWLDAYWREADEGDDEAGEYVTLFTREGGVLFQPIETGAEHPSEFLYLLFLGVTAQLACRQVGDDGREILLRQEALLATLNSEWSERAAVWLHRGENVR